MKPRTGKFLNCKGCNKECYMPINRLKTFKYCSKECKNKFGCTEHIKAICEICKTPFEHISSRCNKAKYCSRRCFYDSQKKKGKTEYNCRHCNKKFMGHKCHSRTFCSIECRGMYQRAPESYINFGCVRKALLRRGFIKKCEKCGYDEVPEILGIHHIDENRKNNVRENLMVLCPMCHSLIHRKHIPHGCLKT